MPTFLFSEALFKPHPHARLASNLIALRSLHSSKPTSSNDAPLFSVNPNEPITAIAERGSTQLSLREPQNKAGTSHPDLLNPPTEQLTRLVFRNRVRFVYIGQDCQLGSTGFDVADDVRSGLLCG